MNKYNVEITDTFAGEANYCWVKRETLTMPDLTHYGYDGSSNYVKANKAYRRQFIRKAKVIAGWTGLRCKVEDYGDRIRIDPSFCNVMFIDYSYSDD